MKGKWIYCDSCNYAIDLGKLKLWDRIPKCPKCNYNIWNTNPNTFIAVPNNNDLIGEL